MYKNNSNNQKRIVYYEYNDLFIYNHCLNSPPANYDNHSHEHYEFYYLINGDVGFLVEGNYYELKKNDLIIFNNNELHKLVINSNEPHERIVISFMPSYLDCLDSDGYNLLKGFAERKRGQNNQIKADIYNKFNINQYINKIEHCIKENYCDMHLIVKLNFSIIITLLNRVFDDYAEESYIIEPVQNNKVLPVIDYINDNIDKNISLESLAAQFFINKYYLCRLFKENTGFTIQDYISHKRIFKAKNLLRQGINASEVSQIVGFNNYYNYYRTFLKVTGKTPRDYMKKICL